MFWKNYGMPLGSPKLTRQALGKSSVRPADLWSSCLERPPADIRITNRLRPSEAATVRRQHPNSRRRFPGIHREPLRRPMVDTQITKWAVVEGGVHSYARIAGPNLMSAPVLAAAVHKGIHCAVR